MGLFSEQLLTHWPSCTRFYAVDLWGHQENYNDIANVDQAEQENRYQETRKRLEPWKDKMVFLRNYTTKAAESIPDNSLDFIYVDARHDYCGVKEDLDTYWPKLKSGGILAGHDYLTAGEVSAKPGETQDWSVCLDGSKHEGAVKGAVDEFAAAHGLSIVVVYDEPAWPSWMARKP
ncbi:Capsular polysaccharide synthesis [Chlorella sorokiniana]|uniref:Capsular polysaccharide synthesis n=1 Tax=Chlorella sorokiniana TaxID=3076 RepID=A0A2P6U4Q7_CHLSO|nr:Capsular polysaccharide synthesis [Chlorella sorokiniana]|eukprot:PRW61289.1 Capsular polysaccharide synthesis [Chlorella sorokiniana]